MRVLWEKTPRSFKKNCTWRWVSWAWLLLMWVTAVSCTNPAPTPTPHSPTAETAATIAIETAVSVTPFPTPSGSGPRIHTLSFAGGDYRQYDKLEFDFEVDTGAANVQWPFDPAPPLGITPAVGVSVDAHFTPDNWQTVYIQPAFFYQDFEAAEKDGRNWIYPTANTTWKVRFTPTEVGQWQVKLTALDASGLFEIDPIPFTVSSNADKGFLRVSSNDPRYFEYSDGTYFPALGYNVQQELTPYEMATLSSNGLQLLRLWLPAQYAIFGSAWSPWRPYGAVPPGSEPNTRLRYDAAPPFNLILGQNPPLAVPESEVFLWLSHDEEIINGQQRRLIPCVVVGWDTMPVAVKRDTDYRVRVRYRLHEVAGPKISGAPYGLTAKLGGWLWDEDDESQRCYAPGSGEVVAASYGETAVWTHFPDPENQGWELLEGVFNSGQRDFIDFFYLALENARSGSALVDHVWLEEVLDDGVHGPNVLPQPWMAQHQYFDQRGSFAFDETLALAETYDLYFKLVILEKNDLSLNLFNFDGSMSPLLPGDQRQPLFFGNGRERDGKTKVRWLQESWWRYLQARWGYSPHIHSWELLNEGPPDVPHFILADEFGKYMQQAFVPPGQERPFPNYHLITTSMWSGFPREFWQGEYAPHLDYADIHYYARPGDITPFEYVYEPTDVFDAAAFSRKLSLAHGALQPFGVGKPLMRGETGWFFAGEDPFLRDDVAGVWLHNLIWAGINAGGMMESYWWSDLHIANPRGDFDYRYLYRSYYDFIRQVPLSNGHYQAADAQSSNTNLRAWGQKDLVNGRAHLWVQNSQHTWKNVLDGVTITAVSGTITLNGFAADQTYRVQWWDTHQPDPAQQILREETLMATANGRLQLQISNLATDIALQITPSPE